MGNASSRYWLEDGFACCDFVRRYHRLSQVNPQPTAGEISARNTGSTNSPIQASCLSARSSGSRKWPVEPKAGHLAADRQNGAHGVLVRAVSLPAFAPGTQAGAPKRRTLSTAFPRRVSEPHFRRERVKTMRPSTLPLLRSLKMVCL